MLLSINNPNVDLRVTTKVYANYIINTGSGVKAELLKISSTDCNLTVEQLIEMTQSKPSCLIDGNHAWLSNIYVNNQKDKALQ